MAIDEYKVGDRVQVHPATDAWMSGDRFGTVTRVGVKYASVKMDRSGQVLMFRGRDILETYGPAEPIATCDFCSYEGPWPCPSHRAGS